MSLEFGLFTHFGGRGGVGGVPSGEDPVPVGLHPPVPKEVFAEGENPLDSLPTHPTHHHGRRVSDYDGNGSRSMKRTSITTGRKKRLDHTVNSTVEISRKELFRDILKGIID